MKKLTKMNEYISFLEASKMYGISESTFRRKLKNLTDKDLTKLTKRMNGRVYISVKELSVFEKIDKNENQIFIQDKEPNNPEIIHLIKQNEKLLQMNQDKDEQIKTLTGYVVQLQNYIQGYIKQLNSGEPNKSEKSDFVLKIIVFSLIIILTIYLIFEPG
jgi:DNA-binding Lrp family transcriptional regulator